jgi:DNA-binding NarL/FixJ family response regulator
VIRVVVVDDQELMRVGFRMVLGAQADIDVVGEAGDGAQAIKMAEELRPDVVLMDVRMPRMDGIEATRRLREDHPDVRVIALTTYADDESVLGALRAGARGYLTKDASGDDIHNAILSVAAGAAALDPAVQNHVVAALSHDARRDGAPSASVTPDLPDELTPREAEVLALIAEGLTNAEIAERLFVSPTTVKSHINHLFAKAGLRDRTQAVNYAYRTGIATPPK